MNKHPKTPIIVLPPFASEWSDAMDLLDREGIPRRAPGVDGAELTLAERVSLLIERCHREVGNESV